MIFYKQRRAWVCPRSQFKYSQTKPNVRVGDVIMTLSENITDRTYISTSRRTIRIGLYLIPKSIEITSSSMIESEVIGRMCYPKGGDRYVSLQHSKYLNRTNSQVVLEKIVCFNSILNKIVMPFDIISNIVLDC